MPTQLLEALLVASEASLISMGVLAAAAAQQAWQAAQQQSQHAQHGVMGPRDAGLGGLAAGGDGVWAVVLLGAVPVLAVNEANGA